MKAPPIVGSWRLVSCQHLRADGAVEFPFGPAPTGKLVYSKDGGMIVLITDPSRPRAPSPQFFEASGLELGEAAKGCVAYSGRWKIDGEEVVHDVEQSLFPNWTGNSLRRAFRADGAHLTLTTETFLIRGIEYTAVLKWRKDG